MQCFAAIVAAAAAAGADLAIAAIAAAIDAAFADMHANGSFLTDDWPTIPLAARAASDADASVNSSLHAGT